MSPKGDKPLEVLYVEDAFDEALLVKTFLESEGGFEVTHTQDGDAALRLLRKEGWDLIITDLNLPGTDGFAVIRAAREQQPDVPIIATTGYTGSHYQEQAFRAGANELVTKPLDKKDFVSRVAVLTGRGPPSGAGGILAVGGLVGDVEMGCGGTLVTAAEKGVDILIVPLCRDDLDTSGTGLDAARQAAEMLGCRILIDEEALDDTARRMELLTSTVAELRPTVAYVPAIDEVHPSRMEAFRISKAATKKVDTVLGYQTATTGMDFKPTRFVDVADAMVRKMEALTAYTSAGGHRVDLSPRLAQAYARYWGRFQKFGEVEAFETIKEPS